MSRLVVSLFVLLLTVSSAQAIERQTVPARDDRDSKAATANGTPTAEAEADANTVTVRQQPAGRTSRGLVPFYVSFAVLQALDVHSTLRAIDQGATEGNVFMQPFASHPAAFIALKAGVTAGFILANTHLSRKHRIAAFAVMLAANGAYGAIVAHNYRVAR